MQRSIIRIILAVLCMVTLSSAPAICQACVSDDSRAVNLSLSQSSGLFESDEILNISLTFDITEYMRDKPEKDYLDAVLTLNTGGSDSVSFDVRIRTRGVSRRNICSFPPIRINLARVTMGYSDLDSVKNIKMVTHCNPGKVFDEYVCKEYLAYKLYNIITDYSFRVRLMRIRYIDTGRRGRNSLKFGFLIEPLSMLESRMGVGEIEDVVLRFRSLVPDMIDRMSIFQYMIGNTDWQVTTYHNINIVKERDKSLAIPIPYDFDYSGFVNAAYALPGVDFGIENVVDRMYIGSCRTDSAYARILAEFLDKKDVFYKAIEDCQFINSKSRKHVNRYLDGFYKLYKKDRIINYLRRTCRDR